MSYNPYDPGALERLTGMYRDQGALQAQQIAQRYRLDKASLAQDMRIASLNSGDRRAAIEQAREDSRGRLEQARQEMLQMGIPRLQLDQFVAQGNQAIAEGELQVRQYAAQGDVAYKQGQLQQQRDEMLQMGIPRLQVDRFVAESNAAIAQGQLGLSRDQMLQIGIPEMLTNRYSAEAQAAYQQGQLGLQQQSQQQTGIEQQRRYALDVARYQQEQMSQPDRYFQAARFGSMVAPRLLGLQGTAGPQGGPTPGVSQMGDLLGQALSGMGPQQAAPWQMPNFPTMPGYNPGPLSQIPNMPTMPAYAPPPLGAMPNFPSGGFDPVNMPNAPWAYPTTPTGGMPALGQGTSQAMQAQGQGQGQGQPTADMMYAGGGGGYDEGGNTAYGGGGQPVATQDTPFGYPSGVGPSGGGSTYGGPSAGSAPGYAPYGPAQMGGGSTYGTQDPRVKQLGAVSRASPPSPYDGLNDQDQATLRLMESIYRQGGRAIAGGEMERLGGAEQGFMKSAGNLLAYDYNDLQHEYQAYRPAQGDARLA